MICTRLCPGHSSVRVGDSSRRSEEIVKILNCTLQCDYYYYYYYYRVSPPAAGCSALQAHVGGGGGGGACPSEELKAACLYIKRQPTSEPTPFRVDILRTHIMKRAAEAVQRNGASCDLGLKTLPHCRIQLHETFRIRRANSGQVKKLYNTPCCAVLYSLAVRVCSYHGQIHCVPTSNHWWLIIYRAWNSSRNWKSQKKYFPWRKKSTSVLFFLWKLRWWIWECKLKVRNWYSLWILVC